LKQALSAAKRKKKLLLQTQNSYPKQLIKEPAAGRFFCYTDEMHRAMGRVLVATLASGLLIAVPFFQAPVAVADTSVDAYRAQLQQQLTDLEAQIAQQQKILDVAQTQEVSLSRDISILNAQIKQAQLAIQARTLVIQQLTTGIQQKQSKIFGLNSQYNSELESLAAIMREKNQLDTASLVVVALSSGSLSDFFSDIDTFNQINAQMQKSFMQITTTRDETEVQKNDLEEQLEEETQLRQVQQLQQAQIAAQQTQKQKILTETKGQEKAYQAIIAQNQKSAAQIRTALFQLTGSAAIPFSKALDYANEAAKATGIRPAFLLGIIAEESNLGENVGTGTWRVDMKAPRDTVPFEAITRSLGLNPDQMPVSKKPWYGYGGAMGPAQFIPSTWALYAGYVGTDFHYDSSKDRVGKRTGNQPPNPWSPEDAFMASAIYLTDNDADLQTTASEFRAAMCYLAGCGNVNNASLKFYGTTVASLAKKYQCQIDIIGGKTNSSACN
jgi:peptidoglycan hydrolase CwlO-like protein